MKKDRFDKVIKENFEFFLRVERSVNRKFSGMVLGDVLSEVWVEIYEKKSWLKVKSGSVRSVIQFVLAIYHRRVVDRLRHIMRKTAPVHISLVMAEKELTYDLMNALDKIIDKGITKEDQEVITAIL